MLFPDISFHYCILNISLSFQDFLIEFSAILKMNYDWIFRLLIIVNRKKKGADYGITSYKVKLKGNEENHLNSKYNVKEKTEK